MNLSNSVALQSFTKQWLAAAESRQNFDNFHNEGHALKKRHRGRVGGGGHAEAVTGIRQRRLDYVAARLTRS